MSKTSNEAKSENKLGGLTRAGSLPFLQKVALELESLPTARELIGTIPEIIAQSEIIRPEDLAYTHSVFVQCFMPVRHNEQNQRRWQTDCGHTSLVIRAGELLK